MFEALHHKLSEISIFEINTLFILAVALFGGTIGGRLLQKMKIPQVVGYIVMGLVLGQSGVGIIDRPMIEALQPLNYFALGLIGFMIGGELKMDVLKRYGRQFLSILLFEGLVSFALVTVSIGIVGSLFLKDAGLAWSLAVLLGAISSATAPAATTDVLWEYKAKGPLTTTVFGIVALDDALSLTLFALASSVATRTLGVAHENVLLAVLHPLYEIGGALLVGLISGRVLIVILKHYFHQKDRILVFLIGMVLFVLGLSVAIHVSMILAAMVLGIVVVNGVPQLSKQVFKLVDNFAPPIYVLFFVFIGAKLNFHSINVLLLVMVGFYLFGRTAGKMSGAYLGALLSGAHPSVRRYLPLCLFSQAGVAVGLSIVASHIVPGPIGEMIIVIVTMSTFVVQLVGPPCVKLAITKADERDKDITEEDLMKTLHVDELMDPDYPVIFESTPLDKILDTFSSSPYIQFPVVDEDRKLTGVINIDSIKNSLLFEGAGPLLLGNDLKEVFGHSVPLNASLQDAKTYMDRCHLGFLPIAGQDGKIKGCFDRRMYRRFMTTKLLELQTESA